MLINQSDKFFHFRRETVVGQGESLEEHDIKSVHEITCKDHAEFMANIDVPEEHKNQIKQIISSNRNLFAQKDTELGHTETVKMKLDTGGIFLLKIGLIDFLLTKRKCVDKAIDEQPEEKIIEKSRSLWSFPIVVVGKRDGTTRMCVDFRSLNKIIRPISFPLPLIDDILTLLRGAKVFTSLDCKSGYYQVSSEENGKEKTAFACHRGLFQFNVIPFGLSTTPSIFQELANIVLQGCEEFATAYLDDILIFSKNEDEHLKHIQEAFDRLRQHGLKLKLKKCNFFKRETEYLGFIINQNVVKPNPDKVKAIRNLPSPKTVRQIRGFMGMIGFYRRFIPNFSQIAEPLIALTKKYTFVLNSSGQLTVKKHLIFLKKVFQWFPFCHIPIQTNPMFYTRMLAIHVLVQFSHKWLMTKKNVLNYTGSETKSRYSSFLKN